MIPTPYAAQLFVQNIFANPPADLRVETHERRIDRPCNLLSYGFDDARSSPSNRSAPIAGTGDAETARDVIFLEVQ